MMDLRGIPGDSIYREYIDPADLQHFQHVGNRMRDAISAVRGHVYTVEPSVLLYPTSGTSVDYAYSRHFVDATKRKVFSYTLETGLEFQPVAAEAQQVIKEVSSGLIEFCNACLCPVETLSSGNGLTTQLERMRQFRDRVMVAQPSGRRYLALLDTHTEEILRLILADKSLRKKAIDVLEKLTDVVAPVHGETSPIPKSLVKSVRDLFKTAAGKASPQLKKTLAALQADLKFFEGHTAENGLQRANANLPD